MKPYLPLLAAMYALTPSSVEAKQMCQPKKETVCYNSCVPLWPAGLSCIPICYERDSLYEQECWEVPDPEPSVDEIINGRHDRYDSLRKSSRSSEELGKQNQNRQDSLLKKKERILKAYLLWEETFEPVRNRRKRVR